jgi:putative phosphoesterase
MRILIVSDIHANWPALAAIDEPHDVCLCLGDLVDYGPDPSRCVRWAMEHASYAVRGNHDHGVSQGIPVTGENGFRYLTRVTRPHMWDALDADERRWLLQLPVTRRVTLGQKRFLLVHATPRDPLDEYLLRDEAGWARRLQNVEADIVCVGHSHMQFKLKIGDKVVINPGSVGLPRDGDPRAAYAVIDDDRIELKRTAYPVEETLARIDAAPWPDRAKEMMSHVLRVGRLPAVGPEQPTTTTEVDPGDVEIDPDDEPVPV